MRDGACSSWIELFRERPFVFLTGDLGFRALEPLRDVMGDHFINAGVAEQNMISVAAGLASQGLDVWCYSIAPFCYARPYEQIRNDVCLHGLPVKLVGNGGGYAYGAMGATHHAIEDYGALLALPGMRVFVPGFDADVGASLRAAADCPGPSYLRLGRSEAPADFVAPPWSPWRRAIEGSGAVVVAVGPIGGALVEALHSLPPGERPSLWLLGELPISELPSALASELERCARLMVVEEHVATGGAGEALARMVLEHGLRLDGFEHATALGYPSGRYGSQAWHRRECGLDSASLLARLQKLRGSGSPG